MIRQGDLLIKKVTDEPKNEKHKELVLALGEMTGHSHRLVAEMDSVILGDKTLFSIKGKAKLVHQEHDTISLSEGTYMVINEREHDYVEETMKIVKD